MENIFFRVFNVSMISVLMIAMVLLFRLLFSKGTSNVRCILWGIVMLRLLIPFHILVPDNSISNHFSRIFSFNNYIYEELYGNHSADIHSQTEKGQDHESMSRSNVHLYDDTSGELPDNQLSLDKSRTIGSESESENTNLYDAGNRYDDENDLEEFYETATNAEGDLNNFLHGDRALDRLAEIIENGELDRIIQENDIPAFLKYVYGEEVETEAAKESDTMPYYEEEYRGMTYRICMDYEDAQEGELITYIGVWNLDKEDWCRVYNRELDEYVSADLTGFLNRSYEAEAYFEFTLPQGFELGEFDGVLSYNQKGWLLKEGERKIPHGAGASVSRYCPGGIGFIEKDSLIFEDGELTGVDWRENHMLGAKAEKIEGLRNSAILKEYTFDLFTMPEWEEYQSEHQEADEAQTGAGSFWYIFMYDEEKDVGYVVFLNKKYFTREDTIEFAASVTVINTQIIRQ